MHKKIIKFKQQNNIYLVLGVILTTSLIIIAIFGEYLAPYDINQNAPVSKINPTTNEIEVAPFPPSREHWLGTDELGLDMFSKLLFGAKYTIGIVFIISISRIIIALPLGLISGWWSKYLEIPIKYFNRSWISMPMFLFIYAILFPIANIPSTKSIQMFIMWFVLTLVGIPPMVETLRGHVKTIKGYEFMDGVKILGGNSFYILRKHILPFIKPQLAIIFAMEMAQILWLLGQLGIVHIFVGGTIKLKDDLLNIDLFYSVTNEWAGLLGNSRKYFKTAPWIFIAPAIAFAYGVLAFQFLAEGIRRKFNKNLLKYDL